MKKRYMLFALFITGFTVQGVLAQTAPAQALKNITLHNTDGSVTKSATIVWRNGVVKATGKKVVIPFDAYVTDGGDSLHVYSGLIDGLANWGSPDLPTDLEDLDEPGNPPLDRAGVQPERKSSVLLTEDKDFGAAMKAGFTTAALSPKGYMLPGQVEVFMLSQENTKAGLLTESIGLSGAFKDAPGRAYPSTLMGVMAKFRQVMFDSKALQQHIQYYQKNSEMTAPNRNIALEALFPLVNNTKPLYFAVDSKEDIERVFILQDQFGFDVVIVSGKEAYAKADELKERNISVLASIDFNDAPKWYADSKKDKKEEDKEQEEITEEEEKYRKRQLEAWKNEVNNIRKLMDADVSVGYASNGMDLKDFDKKVEVLLDEGGLTEKDVLKLMTQNTAQILGIQATFGSITKGKNASFSVFDKPMAEEKAKVVYSISNGSIHELN